MADERTNPKRRGADLRVVLLLATLLVVGCSGRVSTSAERSGTPSRTRESSASQPGATSSVEATSAAEPTVFAVIGDYGTGDAHARAVARLVASWNPEFIITTGDDYYDSARGEGLGRYENSTGALYGRWLPAGGRGYLKGPSAETTTNAFYPSPGNHDYSDTGRGLRTYLEYFALPGDGHASSSGTERYYDFVRGPVHFFSLNSNRDEPGGVDSASRQAEWLQAGLEASEAPWQIAFGHHPSYSSDAQHGSSVSMRWPFANWGADAVLSGHAHTYERVMRDGIVYFVNGLGGATRYGFERPVDGSAVRYRDDWGAQRVTATESALLFEFFDVDGDLVDRYRLQHRS